jgi:chromosome segregation ATPase
LELEQKILQLEETIKQRDLYIDKVTKEKLSAENEKVKYLKEITQKNNEISELKNRNLALEDRISKMIDDNKAEFEKKEKEIANLQAKLNELASANGVDKEVIKRLEELSIRYSSLKEELMVKDQELTRIRVEHFAEKYLSSDDANQMILSVPEIANNSEDALSTIKLSIRAVPKTNN